MPEWMYPFCFTELECLQRIANKVMYIEAFCFAVGVIIALLAFFYILQKVLIYTWGKVSY